MLQKKPQENVKNVSYHLEMGKKSAYNDELYKKDLNAKERELQYAEREIEKHSHHCPR